MQWEKNRYRCIGLMRKKGSEKFLLFDLRDAFSLKEDGKSEKVDFSCLVWSGNGFSELAHGTEYDRNCEKWDISASGIKYRTQSTENFPSRSEVAKQLASAEALISLSVNLP